MQSPNGPDVTRVAGGDDLARVGNPDVEPVRATAAAVVLSEPSPRARLWGRVAMAATLACSAWLLLARLSSYGIWDPWELEVADAARGQIERGESSSNRSFGLWLVTAGFRAFGIHEWAGRLPLALTGVLCALIAFQLAKRFGDLRTATYAALMVATTPFVTLNARTMLGAAPDMALSGALGVCLINVIVAPERSEREPAWRPIAWLLASLGLLGMCIATRGALLAAVPPLGAAAAAAWLAPREHATAWRRVSGLVATALFVMCVALVLRDVQRDAVEHSMWLGGAASSSNPPTFDYVLEQIFHAFAPWSVLLPIALSRLPFAASAADGQDAQQGTRHAVLQACMLWAALAYGAETLFVSRYGHHTTFLAVVPLAVFLACSVRDLERETAPTWGAAIAALLLAGILLRDFVLFPNGVVQGLPLENFEIPKDWNPRLAMAAVCIPFGAFAALGLAVTGAEAQKLDLRAPYRFFRTQWRRGKPWQAWLIALALALLAVCLLGVLAFVIPMRLHMPKVALKIVRPLAFAPIAVAAVVAAGQLLLFGFGKLRSFRMVPLLASGAAFGIFLAQAYLPALSEHFSPREVYTTYNELASASAALAEFRVGGRAAPYYAKGPVIELTSLSQLIEHLTQDGQRWVTFPASELATIDHAYRLKSNRHLFVVDAQSERGMLASSEPIAKREDQNKLATTVFKQVPEAIQHPVSVNFDDHIELLGYTIEGAKDDNVGAGESFTLKWYYRSIKKLSSSYRVFVHIDGEGNRIHGDHDPVEGGYAVTLWEPGDIIVDAQKIEVAASSHAGEYSILMGFYSGDTRLPIRQGPNAGEDRARVGVLRIR